MSAPRIDPKLEQHASLFYAAYPLGAALMSAIVRSGWTVSFVQPFREFQQRNRSPRSAAPSGREWLIRARPPREITDSFDLQVEVLFVISDFNDLQARTLQTVREAVDGDPRVSRDVVFLVTGDESADDKIGQIPKSDGVVPLTWGWVRSAGGGGQGEKPLRARLERYLYARDLFDVQVPVVGNRFFGRQHPLQFLRKQALQDQPVGVFGLRKIGKTSLIKAFVSDSSRWSRDEPVVLAVHLDLQAAPLGRRDWKYVLWDVGRGLWNAWRTHEATAGLPLNSRLFNLKTPPSTNTDVSVAFDQDIRQLLDTAQDKVGETHISIVFDEVERLVPPRSTEQGYEGAVELLRYLRGLNQQGSHVSMVLAGANPYFAERATVAGQENPLLNFVLKYYLAPLEPDEVRFMIQRLGGVMGVKFHHEATASVVQHAGGHPFLTRQLCSVAVRRNTRSRPVVLHRTDVEAALGEYSASQHHTFAQMFDSLADYPDEQFLLRQLARGDLDFVKAWAESDPVGLEHLKGYGLVDVTRSGWEFTIPLFQEYIVNSVP